MVSQPEINLGLIPGFGGTQRLPRLVGKAKAIEIILEGGRITALDAFAIGLVNKVVKGDRLIDEAKVLAENIRNKGMFAVRACLDAVNSGMDMNLKKGLTERRSSLECSVRQKIKKKVSLHFRKENA